MTDALTLYKLIILYMLDRVDFPLTNSQISEFILDKGYTDYFKLQQAIPELSQADSIHVKTTGNSSHYMITDAGEETLSYFGKNISEAIRSEIDEFLTEHKYQLRSENETLADYWKEAPDRYIVRCVVKEKGQPIVDIQLAVPDKDQAVIICDHWREKNSDIYNYLVKTLFV